MGCLKLNILDENFSSLKVVHNSLRVNGESCAGAYLFGFQGQEKENEVYGEGNAYAFKYRTNDVRIGRFTKIDPLASDFPWNSPYAFSENRVIDAIELEGLEMVQFGGEKATTYYIHNMTEEDVEAVLEANYKYHQGNLTIEDFAGKENDDEHWIVYNRTDDWGNSTGTLISRDGKFELRKDISQRLASFDERSEGSEDGANAGTSSAKGDAVGLDIVTDLIPGGVVGQAVGGIKGLYGSVKGTNPIYDAYGVENKEDAMDDVLNGASNSYNIFSAGFYKSKFFGLIGDALQVVGAVKTIYNAIDDEIEPEIDYEKLNQQNQGTAGTGGR